RTRGRAVWKPGRGTAPLPPNSSTRRLRPSPLPCRSIPDMGGGVAPGPVLGARSAGRPARGARRRSGAPIELVSHEAFPRLHPTGHHPERPERLRVLQDAFPGWREAAPASVEAIARCHDQAYVELVRAVDAPRWLDADTPVSESTFEAALLSAGATIDAV